MASSLTRRVRCKALLLSTKPTKNWHALVVCRRAISEFAQGKVVEAQKLEARGESAEACALLMRSLEESGVRSNSSTTPTNTNNTLFLSSNSKSERIAVEGERVRQKAAASHGVVDTSKGAVIFQRYCHVYREGLFV